MTDTERSKKDLPTENSDSKESTCNENEKIIHIDNGIGDSIQKMKNINTSFGNEEQSSYKSEINSSKEVDSGEKKI